MGHPAGHPMVGILGALCGAPIRGGHPRMYQIGHHRTHAKGHPTQHPLGHPRGALPYGAPYRVVYGGRGIIRGILHGIALGILWGILWAIICLRGMRILRWGPAAYGASHGTS